MHKWLLVLVFGGWGMCALASSTLPLAPEKQRVLESRQLERELQALNWTQFRFVLESVPKLRADVDAYGSLGWEYVKARYTRYRWRKSIDKLDFAQKRELAELIEKAKKRR